MAFFKIFLSKMKIIYTLAVLFFLIQSDVSFSAEAPLEFDGRVEYRTDAESQEMLGKQVCFFPSKSASKNVPRPKGDLRMPWFCFANSQEASHKLGFNLKPNSRGCGVTGQAKVLVAGYKRYTGEGDDNDVATLISVMEKSKMNTLPCEK